MRRLGGGWFDSTHLERHDASAGVCELVIGGHTADGTARNPNLALYDTWSDTWSDCTVPGMPEALRGIRVVVGSDERSNGSAERPSQWAA